MSAYVIVEIEVHDAERYEGYKRMAAPSVLAHGGRYVVRGGRAELLEGEGDPKRVVVLEFPTYEQAKGWWSSPDYAAGKALRQQIASSRMIVVEGA